MLKNQRAYQFVFSKTKSKIFSYFAAVSAKTVGIFAALVLSHKKKEYVFVDENNSEDVENLRKSLSKVYPKPKSIKNEISLLPVDEKLDLSVIVPAYNCEKYVEQCVESILKQKTSYNFEVIVINDNSTDATFELIRKFKDMKNVKIIDLKNGGSAAKARNEGILNSTGKNLMFVDSDDFLPENAVELLLNEMKTTSADVVQGGWQYVDENGSFGLFQQYANAEYTNKNSFDRFDLPGMPWGKVFKRELFDDVLFPNEYTCFEDAIIHFFVFRKAKKIVSVKDNVYFWRKNSNGITSTSQSTKKAVQSYWIVEELLELEQKNNLSKDSLFAASLVGQLTNFCYANVSGLSNEIQRNIFALCCVLYKKHLNKFDFSGLPYATKFGAKALEKNRFDLWKLQGKLYQFIK